MIGLENFTTKQQYDIAEFIFAHQTDTLIKSEAESLIQVFKDHHIIDAFVTNLEVDDCLDLLMKNTSLETRDAIMQKYYKGDL